MNSMDPQVVNAMQSANVKKTSAGALGTFGRKQNP
jgi:hypothetical protein